MKKHPFLFLFVIFGISSYAQDTIRSIAYKPNQPKSYFEDRNIKPHYIRINSNLPDNIWQIGKPSKTLFNAAYSPDFALMTDTSHAYPNGNSSSFEFVIKSDDLTQISFWHRLNTDSLADGGVVEFSLDGGTSWANVINSSKFSFHNFYTSASTISSSGNKPGFTGTHGWKRSMIIGYEFNYIRFRFTFTSDGTNTNKEGWIIDNMDFTTLGTGMAEIRKSSLYFFPNPTSDIISLRSEQPINIKSIWVKDILGNTVLNPDLRSAIDLSALQAGIYFIDVNTDEERFFTKVIKQ